MRRKAVQKLMLLGVLAGVLAVTGCGKKKEIDEASTRVIGLTITPMPSPTPIPASDAASADASASSDGVTMLNQYLLDEVLGQ